MNTFFAILFAIGYGVIGVIGTRDKMVFQWPGYLVLGLLGVLTVVTIGRIRRGGANHVCVLATLLFAGYVLARAYVSPVGYFARVEGFLLLSCLLVYLLFVSVLYRTRYRAMAIGFLAMLLVGNVVIGFYHMVNDPTFTVLPGYTRVKPYGAGGFFNNYNHLGGFLEIVTPFLLALCLLGKMSQAWRLVCGFLGVVGVVGIGLTASRGTYLSFSIGMIVLVVICLYLVKGIAPRRFKHVLRAAIVALFVVVIPALFFASKSLDRRFRDASLDVQIASGAEVRMTSWKLAVEQWEESPVFGTGSRTYDQNSIRLWPSHMSRQHGHPEFAHNDYLQLLAEYGLVGLILGGGFYLVHLVAGIVFVGRFRGRAQGLFDNRLALCVGAVCVATIYGCHSFVDFNLHLPANAIPVAFALAVLANPALAWSDRKPLSIPGLSLLPRLAIPLIGVFFLACWKMAPGEYFVEQGNRIDMNEDPAAVIQSMERSLEYDRSNPVAYGVLGTARMLQAARTEGGDYKSAIEAFDKALELMPHDLFSLVGLGRCYLALEQFAKAREAFEEAQEWGPFEVAPHLWYAHALVEQGLWQSEVGDLDGAIALILKAVPFYERARGVQPFQKSTEWREGYMRAHQILSTLYELQGNRLLAEAADAADAGDFRLEVAILKKARPTLQSAIAHSREAAGAPPGFAGSPELGHAHEMAGQRLISRLREHPELETEGGE